MTRYDYEEVLKEDIIEYIRYNYPDVEVADWTDAPDKLYDELYLSDAVTGNASGSYTCNAYEAEENLCHNLSLVADAYSEFGFDGIDFLDSPEAMDVTVRCYLLGQVLHSAVEQAIDDAIFRLEQEDDDNKCGILGEG